MARFLIAAFGVLILVVAVAWFSRDEPAGSDVDDQATMPTPIEPAQPLDTVDEIDVPWVQRSSTLRACPDPEDDLSADEILAEIKAQRQAMLRVLEKSDDAEHLMIAALAARPDDPDSALMLLGEAAFRDPANPMIALELLDLCLDIGHCSRARPEMESNLIAADKANVIAWVQVARSRLARDDEQGALQAMREAAAAAVVEGHFVDLVMAYDRALAASADLEAYARMYAAFMHAVGNLNSATMIFNDCRDRAPESAEWADLCIRVAERLEQDGRMMMFQSIGLGMQAILYKLVGDTREQERTLDRERAFRAQYDPLIPQSVRAVELEDATVMRRFLEIFDASGELEAMRYLADEVEQRLPPPQEVGQQGCQDP